jgi:hypothetical protein
LHVDRIASAYATGMSNDRYTLDLFAQNFASKADESEATNPYYFAAPFSTTLVSPAAYNFVINFMSTHTAEEPNGYLNGDIFKEFFAVTGDYPNFTWQKGQEKVPDNWYKRTDTNQYSAACSKCLRRPWDPVSGISGFFSLGWQHKRCKQLRKYIPLYIN